MIRLPKTLSEPTNRPEHLSASAKWLAGEGAGSYFCIEKANGYLLFEVSRYSPEGRLECKGLFLAKSFFDAEADYSCTYPSHCAKVTVIQKENRITLVSIENKAK